MIKPIEDFNDIIKAIRSELIKQSGLENEHVLDGIDFNGTELTYVDCQGNERPFRQDDLFIVFNLDELTTSSNNVSLVEEDNDIYIYQSYELYLYIYGNKAPDLAKVLRGRINTAKCKYDLRQEGIHVYKVSDITPTREIYNSVIWERKDISIEFTCLMKIKKVDDFENYTRSGFEVIDTN